MESNEFTKIMRVAIIGAGAAGLASARRALQYDVDIIVFEMTDRIGGLWVYKEESVHTDGDENINIPSQALYSSLRVNLPTQLMEFTGYKFEPKSGHSFPHHEEVLEYIDNFANHYDLLKYVKFNHEVLKVSRTREKWNLEVLDTKTDCIYDYEFDGIMVCNGHFSVPVVPSILGIDTFTGSQIHSHSYRRNHKYKNRRVLVVGAGPSGCDISAECAQVATNVGDIIIYYNILGGNSTHLVFLCCGNELLPTKLPDNVIKKQKVACLKPNEAHFCDGTVHQIDDIIYCTGYRYHIPFLDDSCEIQFEKGFIIRPLYKSFLHILHPSMCFIGLLIKTIQFALFDLLAEVYIKLLKKLVPLPSRQIMLEELHELEKRKSKKNPSKYFYTEGKLRDFFHELNDLAQVEPLPPVIFDLYDNNSKKQKIDHFKSKRRKIEIIDDFTYTDEHDNIISDSE